MNVLLAMIRNGEKFDINKHKKSKAECGIGRRAAKGAHLAHVGRGGPRTRIDHERGVGG